MVEIIVGVVVGMLVAWWVVPQPAMLATLKDKVMSMMVKK